MTSARLGVGRLNAFRLNATGPTATATITLGALTLSATATATRSGADITFDSIGLTATVRVRTTATTYVNFDPLTLLARSSVPQTVTVALALAPLTLTGTILPMTVGTARLTLGPLTLSAGGIESHPSRVSILIDGVESRMRVRVNSLSIHWVLNDQPDTADFVCDTIRPTVGQTIRIVLGLNVDTPILLFNGTIEQVDETYEGRPAQLAWKCHAIDDTVATNRRMPFGNFIQTSATTIAQSLVSNFAPGFTSTHVQTGLPLVDVLFDGSEGGMNGCLRALQKLCAAYFYWLDGDLHFFQEETSDAPDPVDDTHPFLDTPPITASLERSQVRTRVYGKGHGESTTGDVLANETFLPIANAAWFSPTGGRAFALGLRFSYGGSVIGGPGALVGPGLSAGAPTLLVLVGGSVDAGAHTYSVTYYTASGETKAGQATAITSGVVLPPDTSPALAVQSGGSVDVGLHYYVVSFLTASGETTPGVYGGASISTFIQIGLVLTDPTATLTLGDPSMGGNLPPGTQIQYEFTFGDATGQTLPSSPTIVFLTAGEQPPAVANLSATFGGSMATGQYGYVLTFVSASGESVAGPARYVTVDNTSNQSAVWLQNIGYAVNSYVTSRKIYRTLKDQSSPFYLLTTIPNNTPNQQYTDTAGSVSGAQPPTSNTHGPRSYQMSVPLGPVGTTRRLIYRTTTGPAAFGLIATINDNTTQVYLDTGGSAGAAPPTVNNTGNPTPMQKVSLTKLPVNPDPGITGRKLYRTTANTSTYLLVATLDATSTSYVDTLADASLGVGPPGTNTATGKQIRVGLSLGPSGTVGRKVYRSKAGTSAPLYLVATIADNTSATYADTATDASLPATTAPGSDTSGLPQPQGEVLGGATALPLSNTLPFSAAGGWVIVGSQAVRFTGLSGNTLTGVPASGAGAILNTVRYGEHADTASMLTGVSGLTTALPKGTPVNVWVQRDDLSAQAMMRTFDHNDANGGIYEHLITDERRGIESLTQLCDADLALYSQPILTIHYATRDIKTKTGKPVTVNLSSPLIVNRTVVIQAVTITEIDVAPNLLPRFDVQASSIRFSLDDMLRRIAGAVLNDLT